MRKRTTQEMGRLSVADYRAADKLPLVVVLDNVRSQHNVGAVFRTADAMRIERVDLCGICCCPPNQELHKTALGAEETVEWRYFTDTLEAVRALQAEGYTVYAVEQAHDASTLEEVAEQIINHPYGDSRSEESAISNPYSYPCRNSSKCALSEYTGVVGVDSALEKTQSVVRADCSCDGRHRIFARLSVRHSRADGCRDDES